jgi:hypothetical protein
MSIKFEAINQTHSYFTSLPVLKESSYLNKTKESFIRNLKSYSMFFSKDTRKPYSYNELTMDLGKIKTSSLEVYNEQDQKLELVNSGIYSTSLEDKVSTQNEVICNQTNVDSIQKLIEIVIPPLLMSSDFNLNQEKSLTSTNSCQTNELMLQKCLIHLDNLKEQQLKERKIKIIQQKISGLILLTIVFIIVFFLACSMIIYLFNFFIF